MRKSYQYYSELEKQGYETRRFDLGEFLKDVIKGELHYNRDDIPLATFLVEAPDATGQTYNRSEFMAMWALQVDFDSGEDFPDDFPYDRILYASPRNSAKLKKFRAWIPFKSDLPLEVLDNPAVRSYLYTMFPGSDEGVTKKTFQRHRLPASLDGYPGYWYDIKLTGKVWDATAELGAVNASNPFVPRPAADVGEMTMGKRAVARNLAREIKARGSYERGSGLHQFLLEVCSKGRSAGLPEELVLSMFSSIELPDSTELERILHHFYENT